MFGTPDSKKSAQGRNTLEKGWGKSNMLVDRLCKGTNARACARVRICGGGSGKKCSSLRLLEAPAQQSTFPATPPLHHTQNCLLATENGPARKRWKPADGMFLHFVKHAILKTTFF